MKLYFEIQYHTQPGQNIMVCGSSKTLGNWNISNALKMHYEHNGKWAAEIDFNSENETIEYKYCLIDEHGNVHWEWGKNRVLSLNEIKSENVYLIENWRAPSKEEKVFYSSAFDKNLMQPKHSKKGKKTNRKKTLRFQIQVPRIGINNQLCILGNIPQLGSWDTKKPLLLNCGENFPLWTVEINAGAIKEPIKYKYGIYDIQKQELVTLEEGEDRYFEVPNLKDDQFLLTKSDESFRYPHGNWKAAGVAVPVFSLRTDNGFGVGEFPDLIDFIDWAKSVGMKMLQILPINETVASHNWLDSYPYKSISVVALHPLYLNIRKMGTLKDKKQMKFFTEKQKEYNEKTHVHYPEVHKLKSKYYKLLFDQDKEETFKQKEYIQFFEANKDWLEPYAAFAYLRDKYKTADFRKWEKYSVYDPKMIKSLIKSRAKDDIIIHYFIQYHLDKQLKEVTEHARKQGVVLKGDIPIGISPNSVEAWTEPHLFNLNVQAGAPPDAFAVKGQNWGFPTYNWEKMAEEGYAWWKGRLKKMGEYFDAYRIDHILGFFRIWEIPLHAVEGLLGYFNPTIALTAEEIENYGIRFDFVRMVEPHIPYHLVEKTFGDRAYEVFEKYLKNNGWGHYKMKKEFDTQLKVNQHFLKDIEEEDLSEENRKIRDGLFDLIANVIFIQTGENQWHPRISMQQTNSYSEFDEHTKNQLNKIYVDYYYKRQDDFWYHKGMEKLPMIIEASDMLVCGEDLGMVPDCVPPVMDALNILSLEIQRMSKNPKKKYAHPADAPYLSVCTTSTHDMPTIRGWWEEDREATQEFYNMELGNHSEAPFFAEPDICKQIIVQHLHSPAMWTTFPIQDLISMDGDLRWEDTHGEQINNPSNVRHKWRFRMHQTIDDLKNAEAFNELLRTLIKESERDSDY
jgi:4-alpha-glucanotransferase